MSGLGTMLWKEIAEFIGNRRSLRVFAMAVLLMGLLPVLETSFHRAGRPGAAAAAAVILPVLGLLYALLASMIVTAQTAPDLVIHERSGHTLEYLLSTRLPHPAILLGKVLFATAVGYGSSLVTVLVQLVAMSVRGGGWTWAYLVTPQAQILVFAGPVAIALYVATVGTFVALRIGDQRSAYMVTMLCVAALGLPFAFQLVHLTYTAAWLTGAVLVLAALAVVLLLVGIRLLRRELLVLYLQE